VSSLDVVCLFGVACEAVIVQDAVSILLAVVVVAAVLLVVVLSVVAALLIVVARLGTTVFAGARPSAVEALTLVTYTQ
jgi:hypothetical protein